MKTYLIIAMIVFMASSAYAVTEITTCQEFCDRPSGDNYSLMNDIDCLNQPINITCAVGIAAGNYFDGQDYKISNFNKTDVDGVFGTISGTLKNLDLDNWYQNRSTSGLVCQNLYGAVINVSVRNSESHVPAEGNSHSLMCLYCYGGEYETSYVTASTLYRGNEASAFIGRIQSNGCTWDRVWSDATIDGSGHTGFYQDVGGLGTRLQVGGWIYDSFFNGTIIGNGITTGNVGCIAGRNVDWVINNTYSDCVIINQSGVMDAFFGAHSGTIQNSYCDNETSGDSNCLGGIEKSDAEMKQQSTFTGWDFDFTWYIDEGVDSPKLRYQVEVPIIALSYPTYSLRQNVSDLNITFTATHLTDTTMECFLYIDDVQDQGKNVTNGTASLFEATYPLGISEWYLKCYDEGNDFTVTQTYLYDYDNQTPYVLSVPNLFNTTTFTDSNITLFGNVTDNSLALVNITVYKPDNTTYYSNTSGNITGQSFYSWDQTLDTTGILDGTWTMYIGATDTVGISELGGLNPVEYHISFEVDNCHPDWDCSGYGECTELNLQYCDSVDDLNDCNESYTGDYSGFAANVCVYDSGSGSGSGGGGGGFPDDEPTEIAETGSVPEPSSPLLSVLGLEVELPSWLQQIINWLKSLEWDAEAFS